MAAQPYKRLPGRGSGILNATSMWEADDHLLLVMSHRVNESYKRFFYRDIQAIVICHTNLGLVLNIVFGLLTALFAVAAIAAGSTAGVIFWVIAGLLLIPLVLNLLRGPTCICTLRTAVQTQPLPSLNRVRVAHKVLTRIQQKIAAAQPGSEPQ